MTYLALAFIALIAVLSARRLFASWLLSSKGLTARATVVGMKPMMEGHHPMVRFMDASDQAHVVPILIEGLNLKVGDTIAVVYLPGAPEKAQLAEPVNVILPALGLIGALCVGYGLLAA